MELGSCRRNQWGRAVGRKRAWKAREILREAEMSQCQLQPRDFGAEIFSAHIMSTEETWAWPSSRRGPAPLNKLLIAHLADDVGACDIQHVHVESLHRTCSDLVPFGSSGDFGSEHSSLRTLVYVPRGRQCHRRAAPGRCDSTRAVVAQAKHIRDGPGHGKSRVGTALVIQHGLRRWFNLCRNNSLLRGSDGIAPASLDSSALSTQESERFALHRHRYGIAFERRNWGTDRLTGRDGARPDRITSCLHRARG